MHTYDHRKQSWKMRGQQTNSFTHLLKEEGPSCFTSHKRRCQIRAQLYQYIRESCGYRRLVENLVFDILGVFYAMGKATQDRNWQTCDYSSSLDKCPNALTDARKEALALAAHVCEKYSIDNQDLVQTIMKEYYILSGNLNDWFDFLNPFGNIERVSDSSLYPYKSESHRGLRQWITGHHLSALAYFLTAAKTLRVYEPLPTRDPEQEPVVFARLTAVDFPIQNILFGWMTPLTLACLSGDPQAVLLLLRHGASVVNPYRRPNWSFLDWSQPLYVLVSQLNERKDDDFDIDVDEEETLQKLEEAQDPLETMGICRARKLLKCMSYICRTSSSLPLLFTTNVTTENSSTDFVFLHSKFRAVLPTWLQRKDATPLQQLCKCKVRAALHENDALPHGIQKLPLPVTIKEYLDLMRDWNLALERHARFFTHGTCCMYQSLQGLGVADNKIGDVYEHQTCASQYTKMLFLKTSLTQGKSLIDLLTFHRSNHETTWSSLSFLWQSSFQFYSLWRFLDLSFKAFRHQANTEYSCTPFEKITILLDKTQVVARSRRWSNSIYDLYQNTGIVTAELPY